MFDYDVLLMAILVLVVFLIGCLFGMFLKGDGLGESSDFKFASIIIAICIIVPSIIFAISKIFE